MRQFLETGMSLDGLRNEFEFVGSDTLAVVFAVFMALEQMVGALSEQASTAVALVGLLAETAANHGVDGGHLLEDLSSFLLERGG